MLAMDDTAMHPCRNTGAGSRDRNCGALWQETDPRSAAGKPGCHSCPKSSHLSRCNAVLQASSGRRPLEAWQAVADLLGIDRTAQQLFDESEPLLEHRSAPRPQQVTLQHHGQPVMAPWQSLLFTLPWTRPYHAQHHALQLSAMIHILSRSHSTSWHTKWPQHLSAWSRPCQGPATCCGSAKGLEHLSQAA